MISVILCFKSQLLHKWQNRTRYFHIIILFTTTAEKKATHKTPCQDSSHLYENIRVQKKDKRKTLHEPTGKCCPEIRLADLNTTIKPHCINQCAQFDMQVNHSILWNWKFSKRWRFTRVSCSSQAMWLEQGAVLLSRARLGKNLLLLSLAHTLNVPRSSTRPRGILTHETTIDETATLCTGILFRSKQHIQFL